MEEKTLTRGLYVVATFISVAAGCLALAIEVVAQFFFLKGVPRFLILTDLAFAIIIAGVVLLISLVNIGVINYTSNEISNEKLLRTRFLLGFVFSSIPLFIGYLLIRFLGIFIVQKIDLHLGVSKVISYQVSPIIFIALFIGVLFFSYTLIYISLNYAISTITKQKLELENAQLKIKNIEATYQQLKQQVNPHFLFNSLNTLKTLIKNNPDAEVFLKRLSDFLRASVSFNSENTIRLEEEMKLCTNYLELQKVRFGDALQFSIHIPEDVKSGLVPLFSIQQLIENAIKHNVLTINHPLHINIKCENNRIVVSNNVKIKNTSEESTGVGLSNLAERYKILSGDEVIIRSDNNCFSVSIKILDHEDSNHRG